ncbi:hypothetical protein [Desulfosediminicola ganghwensis]|uniref:hypothetical protein n=1 Tax=Desulfosediminicola ganghwensis TaxID=2569540 RepID=UPI0010AC599D|nr:hypothetical protein [Desulfosediminicola ganghwensis]
MGENKPGMAGGLCYWLAVLLRCHFWQQGDFVIIAGIVIMIITITGDYDIKTSKNTYFACDEPGFGVSWV